MTNEVTRADDSPWAVATYAPSMGGAAVAARGEAPGHDLSFAWRHLQIWAEIYAARFEVPHVGDADTFACYLEAKYKFTPAFFAALRWNQQFFGNVPNGYGREVRWGKDTWRADAACAYRFSAHTQLKVQYSLENAVYSSNLGHMFAVQFTVRF